MNMQVFIDLIIRKSYESGMYNELGEAKLRVVLKAALDDKYDSLINILNLKMSLDADNCTYNAAFYEKELKKINKVMREYVSELAKVTVE
jgi:hypothetical protein